MEASGEKRFGIMEITRPTARAKRDCADLLIPIDHDDFSGTSRGSKRSLSQAAFQPHSASTAKLGWTAQ
jgi:hypothetical protein